MTDVCVCLPATHGFDPLLRCILTERGALPCAASLGEDADLFDAGLDSFGMVGVMIGIEEMFGCEFTAAVLQRESFRSIAALRAVVLSLGGHP